jgi:hypothetical protein
LVATTFVDNLDQFESFTDRCRTEILGLRATLHGNALKIRYMFAELKSTDLLTRQV